MPGWYPYWQKKKDGLGNNGQPICKFLMRLSIGNDATRSLSAVKTGRTPEEIAEQAQRALRWQYYILHADQVDDIIHRARSISVGLNA